MLALTEMWALILRSLQDITSTSQCTFLCSFSSSTPSVRVLLVRRRFSLEWVHWDLPNEEEMAIHFLQRWEGWSWNSKRFGNPGLVLDVIWRAWALRLQPESLQAIMEGDDTASVGVCAWVIERQKLRLSGTQTVNGDHKFRGWCGVATLANQF